MIGRAPAIRLLRHRLSGHSHRVELFLSILGLPYELVDVDVCKGEQRSEWFLRINPAGQVPVLEDGDLRLSESNAILVYLARRYAPPSWLPQEPRQAATVERWLSYAAGPIAYGLAAARRFKLVDGGLDEKAIATGVRVLARLDVELADRKFAAGELPTIADLAAYAYIARAPEGGISLGLFNNVKAWLERVEALPGFVPMASAAPGTDLTEATLSRVDHPAEA